MQEFSLIQRKKQAINIIFIASPYKKIPGLSHKFVRPQLSLWFAVLKIAIEDIGILQKGGKVRSFELSAGQKDSKRQFKDGELDIIAEQLSIEPEYMRDVLKMTGLIG